jgi:protocatechuate 3,4-dioxygenase beta subunit
METNRRRFLKLTGAAAAGALMMKPAADAFAQACGLTPAQTSGPFYPGENQFSTDTDLTLIPGHQQRAEGQVIIVKGRVLDPLCNPIKGANVEIWQACHTGKYNHDQDPNPAAIDPHFRYWAEAFTNENGEYAFKTILPGAYPADTDWTRPPHIHFRITRLGYRDLVTQMYFKGNAYNDRDLILRQIPKEERNSVIVDFVPATQNDGSLTGTFDITLRSVRN